MDRRGTVSTRRGKAPAGVLAFALCTATSYGLFSAVVPTGIFGAVCLASLFGWRTTFLCQAIFIVATLLPRPHITLDATAWGKHEGVAASLLLGAVALGMAFLTFSVGSTAAYIVGLFVAGYAGAILRQLWYSQYLLIYKSWCRRACSQAAVVGFLPTVVLMLTYPFLAGKALLTGLSFILAIAMSLVALLAAQAVRPTSAQKSGENAKRGTYALSEYSAVLLGVFGLSWGIACSEIAGAVWGSSQPAALPWMVALAFVLALAILQLEGHLEGDGALRSTFGLRVRCIVALAGAVWVSSPFLSASAPAALFVAIVAVYMIQFILMLMFSAEISIEKGLPLGQVASKNCMLFYGCTLLGIVIHGLLSVLFSEVQLLYDALAMATVIPSLALIPLLPSRTSSAATFTLTALPEDENLDLRIETGRRVLAEFHGLTEREAQIADLLVEGCTRGEIAERLQLSPWTVKTHAASVYKKVGVHSNKELLRRLEELGSGKR